MNLLNDKIRNDPEFVLYHFLSKISKDTTPVLIGTYYALGHLKEVRFIMEVDLYEKYQKTNL